MSQLENIIFNGKQPILKAFDAAMWNMPQFTSDDSVADFETQQMMQLDRLFTSINHTATQVGAATLWRSLKSHPLPLELIAEKQESLRELETRHELAEDLSQLMHSIAPHERGFLKFLKGEFSVYDQYRLYKKSRAFFLTMANGIRTMPRPRTRYLDFLVNTIDEAGSSRSYDCFKGPVYRTLTGLKPRSEMLIATPLNYKLTLRYTKPIVWLAPIGAVAAALFIPLPEIKKYAPMAALSLYLYIPIASGLPNKLDSAMFFDPLRKIHLEDQKLQRAVEAAGRLDELLSFHKYSQSSAGPMTLPVVEDSPKHYMLVNNARNPVLDRELPEAVPNNIALNGKRLMFVTGPNSGGKTTYCETIAHIQLLGQIGCYVPAESAAMSIADRIFYQGPAFSALNMDGRFGTELNRTKDIFLKTTPKSLVILDELAEGTTFQAKMKHSRDILLGFRAIGNNTVLVTHNYELVQELMQSQKGVPLMASFDGEQATFYMAPGISTDSHADIVAKRNRFSGDDILAHLKEKGYICPEIKSLAEIPDK